MLLYQIGLKLGLSVGTVLTSRQIPCSPNFSRTVDSDAIGKWVGGVGKGPVLPYCIKICMGSIRPPCPIACSNFHPWCMGLTNERTNRELPLSS